MKADEIKKLALNYEGATEWLSPKELQAAFPRHCWRKVKAVKEYGFTTTKVYVKLRGKQLFLGRCDLFHQVHSSIGFTTEKEFFRDPVRFYVRKGRYFGAVVVGDSIYVIDSLTDG